MAVAKPEFSGKFFAALYDRVQDADSWQQIKHAVDKAKTAFDEADYELELLEDTLDRLEDKPDAEYMEKEELEYRIADQQEVVSERQFEYYVYDALAYIRFASHPEEQETIRKDKVLVLIAHMYDELQDGWDDDGMHGASKYYHSDFNNEFRLLEVQIVCKILDDLRMAHGGEKDDKGHFLKVNRDNKVHANEDNTIAVSVQEFQDSFLAELDYSLDRSEDWRRSLR